MATKHQDIMDVRPPSPPGYAPWISMGNCGLQVEGKRVADDVESAWEHYFKQSPQPMLFPCMCTGEGRIIDTPCRKCLRSVQLTNELRHVEEGTATDRTVSSRRASATTAEGQE